MVNCGASDALRCRLFPETFARRANEWFTSLAPGSVHDFTQLLLAMMQVEDESLKSYLKRFTDHSTPLERDHMSLCTAAFKHGLSASPFNNSLTRRPAKTMDEVRHRASGFIKEETDDMRKKKRQEDVSKEVPPVVATNTKSERKNETRSSKNEQRAHYASRRQETAAPYQSQ